VKFYLLRGSASSTEGGTGGSLATEGQQQDIDFNGAGEKDGSFYYMGTHKKGENRLG